MTRRAEVNPGAVSMSTGTLPGDNPFPGPRAYRRNDQQYFFGRSDEVEELTSLVLSSSATLLYAPSGAGKSSLLQAGVAPHLERRFDFVVLPTVHLGAAARAGPADDAPNRFIYTVCEAINHGDGPIPDDIAAAAATRRTDPSRRVLLILDQFETVFSDPILWQQREDFFTALTRALEENTWLRAIIALRSDYLADLVPYERYLPANLVVRYQLENLTENQAESAIASAFTASGLSLADTDLRTILDALSEDTSRPPGSHRVPAQYVNTIQLQIVCRRLWEEIRERDTAPSRGPVLTPTSFDPRNAVSQFVDNAITQVVKRTHGSEAAIRWWLGTNMITPSGQRAFVLVDEAGSAGLPSAVIEALEEVRLIQLEQRHGLRLAELTHDSMTAGVRASNEAWVRSRSRRRWRSAAMLLVLLIGLLAAFPFLRAPGEELVAGPLTDDVSGENARLEFSGSPRAVIVDALMSSQEVRRPAILKIVEVLPGAGEKTLIEKNIALGPPFLTTVPVRTVPDHTYAAVLDAPGAEYKLTVRTLPTVPADRLQVPLVPGSRVAVLLEPGQRELITVPALDGVAGVKPIEMDVSEGWAIVEGAPGTPNIAVLVLDPEEVRFLNSEAGDPEQSPIGRRASLDQPTPVAPGGQSEVGVAPFGSASLDISSDLHRVGAEVRCTHSIRAKVDYGDADPTSVLTVWTNVGQQWTVLPLNAERPGPQLLLDGPDDELSATCTVRIKIDESDAMTLGQNDLVVSNSSNAAAFPILFPHDTLLIMNQEDQLNAPVSASVECAERTRRWAASDSRFLAFVPAGSSCDLWLVKTGSSAGDVSLPVWVVAVSDDGGG